MCVDVAGNLWIAHVGGGRVVQLDPTGELLDEVPVPARVVTSVAFGGAEWDELYIVTADNTDEPGRGGCVFKGRPGSQGVPTPMARV
jgi:sugar lactone lactonase YvrE